MIQRVTAIYSLLYLSLYLSKIFDISSLKLIFLAQYSKKYKDIIEKLRFVVLYFVKFSWRFFPKRKYSCKKLVEIQNLRIAEVFQLCCKEIAPASVLCFRHHAYNKFVAYARFRWRASSRLFISPVALRNRLYCLSFLYLYTECPNLSPVFSCNYSFYQKSLIVSSN